MDLGQGRQIRESEEKIPGVPGRFPDVLSVSALYSHCTSPSRCGPRNPELYPGVSAVFDRLRFVLLAGNCRFAHRISGELQRVYQHRYQRTLEIPHTIVHVI